MARERERTKSQHMSTKESKREHTPTLTGLNRNKSSQNRTSQRRQRATPWRPYGECLARGRWDASRWNGEGQRRAQVTREAIASLRVLRRDTAKERKGASGPRGQGGERERRELRGFKKKQEPRVKIRADVIWSTAWIIQTIKWFCLIDF